MATNSGIPYAYPTTTRSVSDSFQDHVNRGSVNPGTDYMAAWGSPVYAVQDGVISGTEPGFAGSGGRMIYLDLDDGSGVDYLHLSQLNVLAGERVLRGQIIGYSGASGYGSEWWYGAHLHISIRPTRSYHTMNHGNYDFDAFIKAQWSNMNWAGGGAVPIVEIGDEDMKLVGNPQGVGYITGPGVVFPLASYGGLGKLLGDPVPLAQADFDAYVSACLSARRQDIRVYANTQTGAWYVGGPSIWYQIPSGDGPLWTALYGDAYKVDDATLLKYRKGFIGQ